MLAGNISGTVDTPDQTHNGAQNAQTEGQDGRGRKENHNTKEEKLENTVEGQEGGQEERRRSFPVCAAEGG